MFGRDPLLILNTSAYHFCKFSLVKKPKTSVKVAEEQPKNCDEEEAGDTLNAQYTDDSEKSVEDSGLLHGMYVLLGLSRSFVFSTFHHGSD